MQERTVRLGPLSGYVGYALRRAQLWSVAAYWDAMKEVDLRPSHFAVLILVNENPGIRPTEVCAALGLQKANFVPLLNELEGRSLVVRQGVPDRRSAALHLTPEGKALHERALKLHENLENLVVQRLGAEGCEQLLALLTKLMLPPGPGAGFEGTASGGPLT
jgi:DNA-binding MarR family transcriptional regulator